MKEMRLQTGNEQGLLQTVPIPELPSPLSAPFSILILTNSRKGEGNNFRSLKGCHDSVIKRLELKLVSVIKRLIEFAHSEAEFSVILSVAGIRPGRQEHENFDRSLFRLQHAHWLGNQTNANIGLIRDEHGVVHLGDLGILLIGGDLGRNLGVVFKNQ